MLGLNPYTILGAIGAVIAVFAFGLWKGYSYEHEKFIAFKAQAEAQAKIQEAKVESITKQQALVTKGIKDEYDAKLAAVRNYYKSTSVWNDTNSSKVSGISAAPSSADVIAAYNVFAGQCAETTLQLTQLQKWLNEQVGVK